MSANRYPPLSTPLSVLILDDERFDRHRLARLCSGLDRPTEVTSAVNVSAFETCLDNGTFELILVDYILPDGTGLEALEAVRCSPRNHHSATIMITGQMDDDVAKAALRGGCADYLSKDELTENTFTRAVTNALKRAALSLEVEAQTFARAEVETVLEAFASRFARDIKPMVSRTLRQLRDQRGNPTAESIPAIEASCLTIWETLVELERHSGGQMFADTLLSAAPARMPPPIRKPPSPFSRVRN